LRKEDLSRSKSLTQSAVRVDGAKHVNTLVDEKNPVNAPKHVAIHQLGSETPTTEDERAPGAQRANAVMVDFKMHRSVLVPADNVIDEIDFHGGLAGLLNS